MSYGRLEVNLVALEKIKRPIAIMKLLFKKDGAYQMYLPFRPFLSVRWAGCVAWGSIVGCCHTCKCPGRPRRDTPTPNMSRLAAEHKSTFVQCIVHETMTQWGYSSASRNFWPGQNFCLQAEISSTQLKVAHFVTGKNEFRKTFTNFLKVTSM